MSGHPESYERSGLAIVWDIVVAPRAAFEALRERSHWGWAFLTLTVLGLIGGFLQVPAGQHLALTVMQQTFAQDPNLADLSPEKRQNMLHLATLTQQYAWLFFPVIALVAILIASLVFLLGSSIAQGRGTFARLFGLAANIATINFGIGYLLVGILTRLRGADNFNSTKDLITVLPSLAWLVPGASAKLTVFLSVVNPLQIWSFFLIAFGLAIVAQIPRLAAYLVAAIVTLGSIVVPALTAR